MRSGPQPQLPRHRLFCFGTSLSCLPQAQRSLQLSEEPITLRDPRRSATGSTQTNTLRNDVRAFCLLQNCAISFRLALKTMLKTPRANLCTRGPDWDQRSPSHPPSMKSDISVAAYVVLRERRHFTGCGVRRRLFYGETRHNAHSRCGDSETATSGLFRRGVSHNGV